MLKLQKAYSKKAQIFSKKYQNPTNKVNNPMKQQQIGREFSNILLSLRFLQLFLHQPNNKYPHSLRKNYFLNKIC